jgi:hypothetical protein
MCTLYKGIPFGPAYIEYYDNETISKRFYGIGIFSNGKLHNGPFLCQMGDDSTNEKRRLFTHMIDGRPAEKHFGTIFF